ncbi:dual specificity protein tyrosine phosphatase CCP1 [Oryzias latipes]|uniref:protein-tyrosine-phosphatase n=1 Tax=Oryzias latipes TaxID=8090 RepID=H2M4H1_ORYLA|nr:dual specificity protein tyrosine phosphatase CCP1 [Oryzias latipes]XP_020564679.1 dual specificity protein tyrosine phosphatase CCP1 [Oryzias latipes]
MPPLPLDERIVVIQRPKNLAFCEASPETISQHPSHITSSSNGHSSHHPHVQPSQSQCYLPSYKSQSVECKRRSSRVQKCKGEHPVIPPVVRHIPSHCHSNGTVTLGPRLPSHTHTIDIKVKVDKGGRGVPSNSLGRGGSLKGGKGKGVFSQLDQGQCERRTESTERPRGVEHKSQRIRQLSSGPGGVLQFVPAQAQQYNFRGEKEKENASFQNRSEQKIPSLSHKKTSKLGTAHQSHNSHSLPFQHNSVPVPHAAILNSNHPSSFSAQSSHVPASTQQAQRPRSRDQRPHIFHGLPLSPCSSNAGGFPSPDHTCTIDCRHPFICGCLRLVRCGACKGDSSSFRGRGGSTSTSFSCGPNVEAVRGGSKEMSLRNLGGCLSTTSTSNTSSSNSTVSDCRANLFKPLRCASCSGEARNFESPAVLRKKLVGGCLPCTPLSSTAPLRAIQSCVTGCNPKASQTGSSTCSYCSSDPIVVTYNPRRGKPPGRSIGAPHPMAMFHPNGDDYSARSKWPEELANKMTQSKGQKTNSGLGAGLGKSCAVQSQGGSNGTSPVLLDCQNLQDYAQKHFIDLAGRRQFQQGKMSTIDFVGSRFGLRYDEGRSSLKRLLTKGEEAGFSDGPDQDETTPYHRSPSPRSVSLPSPVSFSPPPSAPSTLIKPKPWQRDRDGGHSLPSAQSLHLALNSLNREQDEENNRMRLSLPLSSSLPASLSDETVMTPDAENAVISPILPFLFLGNERDAQDLDLLLRLNIGYVVNVTTHLPLYHINSGLRYKRLPATDNSKQNLRQYFEEVFEFIEEAYQSGQGVLVHCQAGVSRSATIVIAYLMKHTLMTMTDAYKYVRSRRPVVSPNLNFMGQLLEFERDLNSGLTPRILMPRLNGVETQV